MVQVAEGKFTAVAVDLIFKPAGQGIYLSTLLKFDTIPTTPEDIEVIVKHPNDSDFDTILEAVDPSTKQVTSWSFRYHPFPLVNGYTIQVTYPNSDDNNIAVAIYGTDTIMMP